MNNPKLQQFVSDQLQSGKFSSADEIIETALARMMDEELLSLSSGELAEIEAADAEISRSEAVDFEVFAKKMRSQFRD
ncbi:MAG: type II toxin-antitoxin system ParD family antitoxin [Burkholderiales bacterium]|nr:type II toxin-antitoxin system ParD family antitoxin [Phycisphaerae bacterium]